jgi:hypothetical protein
VRSAALCARDVRRPARPTQRGDWVRCVGATCAVVCLRRAARVRLRRQCVMSSISNQFGFSRPEVPAGEHVIDRAEEHCSPVSAQLNSFSRLARLEARPLGGGGGVGGGRWSAAAVEGAPRQTCAAVGELKRI